VQRLKGYELRRYGHATIPSDISTRRTYFSRNNLATLGALDAGRLRGRGIGRLYSLSLCMTSIFGSFPSWTRLTRFYNRL